MTKMKKLLAGVFCLAALCFALTGCSSSAPAAEEEIIALYPTIFDRYRTSNYSVETLRGEPMPGFALPTLTGERYMRNKGDRFPNPTVVALLDLRGVHEALVVVQYRLGEAGRSR